MSPARGPAALNHMIDLVRFVDSSNGTVGGRHYEIQWPDGTVAWTCDTTGPAVNETIGFLGRQGSVEFTLVPERSVMNRGFTMYPGDGNGPPQATLTTRGFGHEWKVLAPDGEERFRIVDPTGKVEATVRFIFESFTDEYALLAQGQIAGRIGRHPRPEDENGPRGLRGLLRRMIKASDWTLTLDDESVDRHEAVAAVFLLLERQIRGRGGMV